MTVNTATRAGFRHCEALWMGSCGTKTCWVVKHVGYQQSLARMPRRCATRERVSPLQLTFINKQCCIQGLMARGQEQGQGLEVQKQGQGQGHGLVNGPRGQGQGLSSRTTTLGYSEEWLTC